MDNKRPPYKRAQNRVLRKPSQTQSESVRRLREQRIVVSEEELIPFSWRHPLAPPDNAKMTKVYREVVETEKALVPRDK